jgi:uncharacterized caspase-like protein
MASSIVYKQKHALAIGINSYPRDPLKYCINDAKDLKETLQSISFNVLLGKNCNESEFYSIIDKFAGTIQRDDLALFYFAGHGKQNNDKNYLLPSDYDYDYREDEHNYIVDHAINVEYIMKKINDRKCRIAIYLFDCCRNLVRTRASDANQGLSPMNASAYVLIVFACAPGKAVQDETQNGRNSSFMENLLKHITTPNKDIEEIIKDVARAVNVQTGGFQLPYRTSCITEKVFLVTNTNDGKHIFF